MNWPGFVAGAFVIVLILLFVVGKTITAHAQLEQSKSYSSKPWWMKMLAIVLLLLLFLVALVLKAA